MSRWFPEGFNPSNLVDVLQYRAEKTPDRMSYTFLLDGEDDELVYTYAEIDRKIRAVAAQLQWMGLEGERALMLYPPGLEFVIAFYACFYAGVIAVPAYPPELGRLQRSLPRLQAIAKDSGAKVVLTTEQVLMMAEAMHQQAPDLAKMRWLATDAADDDTADMWQRPDINGDTLAFLQYTSGSTGDPKGVMITHGNLMHNEEVICSKGSMDEKSRYVAWLPLFHDMGLIGCVMQPLFSGADCILMSPIAFLQRPFRWLKAISKYRGFISGGPNFCYELCVKKIKPAERDTLDLSSWRISFNGAEPVRQSTLERFSDYFAPVGFDMKTFFPCYGLAESTVFVTGGVWSELHRWCTISTSRLADGDAVEVDSSEPDALTLVSCGFTAHEQELCIVNTDTMVRCEDNRVGEIWTRGRSVALGYWGRPEATAEAYEGFLSDGDGPWLRTGDVGFMRDGEMYMTGRIKDLIIIRGRNYYPQDVEGTTERAHAAVRLGCTAAFSIVVNEEERLAVVAEINVKDPNLVLDDVITNIRRAIAAERELSVYNITLIRPRTIHKTSSGKIQRRATKKAFEAGMLDVLTYKVFSGGSSILKKRSRTPIVPAAQVEVIRAPTGEAIDQWLAREIAERTGTSLDKIDLEKPFTDYGLDSRTAVELSGDLSELLAKNLPPTLLYDYPNISALARFIEQQSQVSPGAAKRKTGADEPIAIIGMGGRFPGHANTPEAFWKLLSEGVDAVSEVPGNRWDVNTFYDPDPKAPGKTYSRWGGFVDDVEGFDAPFFGIAPKEATAMDPQQRLLLEVTWEALEHAGLPPDRLMGTSAGVFVGISSNDYSRRSIGSGDLLAIDAYSGTGNAFSVAAGRIAYLLGVQGPTLSVDTACSSSLVSVHLACQALRNGECSLALAGGVNLILGPELTVYFSKLQAMSPTGRCHTFSAAADGYVRSEGAGMVVLKSLSQAQEDGDPILAVIRGTAVNQDGRSNGLTAPNGPSQQAVIRQALEASNLAPNEIDYVEAHGTGTELGDPIEVQALGAVFTPDRDKDKPLYVGSAKSNIGHAESAAGIAALMKVVLSLQHQTIPPSLHFDTPSSHIPWEKLAVKVPTSPTEWLAGSEKRRAGVSSFGFSGTNAHLILEEAEQPPKPPAIRQHPLELIPLSARSDGALKAQAASLATHLTAHPEMPLHAIGVSTRLSRAHYDKRASFLTSDRDTLIPSLQAFAEGRSSGAFERTVRSSGPRPKVAFLFTGQGSQYAGMGKSLYALEPVFKTAIDRCAALLRPHLETPLWAVLYPEEGQDSPIDQTAYTQPALFALEYALAELWKSWGITPDVVLGHSVGEYTAAVVAGVMSLEDGIRLIAERGRLMQALPEGGAMAAVQADEPTVRAAIAEHEAQVSLAAINGPTNLVISGEGAVVRAICGALEASGIKTTALNVSHAFHSPLMDPMLEAFKTVAGKLTLNKARIPMVSNVSGTLAGEALSDADYWCRHVRSPVAFAAGMKTLEAQGVQLFLEIGPAPVLCGMGAASISSGEVLWLPSLRKSRDDYEVLYSSLGQLYAHGGTIDWRGFDAYVTRTRVPLPSYPWQRARHWLEPVTTGQRSQRGSLRHPTLGEQLEVLPNRPNDRQWRLELRSDHPLLMADGLEDVGVLCLGGFAELCFSAAEAAGQGSLTTFQGTMLTPLYVGAEPGGELQLSFSLPGLEEDSVGGSPEDKQATVALHHRASTEDDWSKVAEGFLIADESIAQDFSFAEAHQTCGDELDQEDWQPTLTRAKHPPEAWLISDLWVGKQEALIKLKSPNTTGLARQQIVSAMQQALVVITDDGEQPPLRIQSGKVQWFHSPGDLADAAWLSLKWCHLLMGFKGSFFVSARVIDEAGRVLGVVTNMTLTRVLHTAIRLKGGHDLHAGWFYDLNWREITALGEVSGGRWMLLADQGDLGTGLKGALEAAGDTAVLVPREGAGGGLDGVAERLQDPLGWQGIVHLWGLDASDTDLDLPGVRRAQQHGVQTGLALTNLLKARKSAPELWLVTRGSQAVFDEAVNPAQAPLWGLGKVVALEHGGFFGGLIDLDPAAGEGEATLLAETLRRPTGEDQVALRAGRRHGARLVPTPVPARAEFVCKRGGSYLITGGLGGLGRAVARFLAESGAGHLVLTSRSGLPKRDDWEDQTDPEVCARIATVRALETSGVPVTFAPVDVCDLEGMRRMIESLDGYLTGVVHAAGVGPVAPLDSSDAESLLERTLKPKVDGAWVLHEVTRDLSLDFFVLFSSVASVWGGQGQGYYAAANAFLDGLAHHRRARGLPALSINWGPWQEGGMNTAENAALLKSIGLTGMETGLGLDAMARLIAADVPQKTVASVDWGVFKPIYEIRGERRLLAELHGVDEGAQGGEELLAKLEGLSAEDALDVLQETLADAVGAVLGYSADQEVPLHRGFVDMGMDSLMAVQLMTKLKKFVGQDLPNTLVFEQANIAALARYLAEDVLKLNEREAVPDPVEALSEGELVSELENLLADFD